MFITSKSRYGIHVIISQILYRKVMLYRGTTSPVQCISILPNFKVQRDRKLFVLNCPPHDSKLSEIDYDDRSEEEQHRNNNFLQTFCRKNVKTKSVLKSEYAKAEVPLSKNLRRGNRGFRRSGGPLPLLRKLQNLSQCNRALSK